MIATLHALGYVILDIVEENRVNGPGLRKGILNQVDFAFVQKNSSLIQTANDIGIRHKEINPHPSAQQHHKGKKEGGWKLW